MRTSLISHFEIRGRLKELLSGADSIILLSAYVKSSALDWIADVISPDCIVTLISRFNLGDIVSGASDLSVIDSALKLGWSVKRVPTLHAKVFLFDNNELIIGSANLTSSGLMLSGSGNLEVAVEVGANENDVLCIQKIIQEAQTLNFNTYQKLEDFYFKQSFFKKTGSPVLDWPEDLFSENVKVWVNDFLWLTNKNLTGASKQNDSVQDIFLNSRAYIWLINVLRANHSKSMKFGELSFLLHNDLCDDPLPYRSNVKELLAGLITSSEIYAKDDLSIDRPGYSQVITLK